MERTEQLAWAIDKLGKEFPSLDLTFHQIKDGIPGDVTSYWPGAEDEDVLVCVFRGSTIHEPFHRQDFFFINYAWRHSYQALSEKYNNLITIDEDACYIGQPYSGYALRANGPADTTIIGILIRKNFFYRSYLPTLAENEALFRFFLEPQTKKYSDEYIHLPFTKSHPVRTLMELMVMEYADRKADTQEVLKSLLRTLLLEIARRYRAELPPVRKPLIGQILEYLGAHMDSVTLLGLAKHFGYHPNYLSTLIRDETGKTFTRLLLQRRMERAVALMRRTDLSLEEIGAMVGYSDHSNFFKAFREYYGMTPGQYLKSPRSS